MDDERERKREIEWKKKAMLKSWVVGDR